MAAVADDDDERWLAMSLVGLCPALTGSRTEFFRHEHNDVFKSEYFYIGDFIKVRPHRENFHFPPSKRIVVVVTDIRISQDKNTSRSATTNGTNKLDDRTQTKSRHPSAQCIKAENRKTKKRDVIVGTFTVHTMVKNSSKSE